MLHTIQNEYLRVTVSEQGAELRSILGADGTQYLWQGDPAYWSDRAMNIFPYVARLTQGSYYLDGQLYRMKIHGIAMYRRFVLEYCEDTAMTFLLESDAETLVQYPRAFAFRITYALEGSRLDVTFRVDNRDQRTMYFGLGGHPGFMVPLEAGKTFEDYRLRFGECCGPRRVGFTSACYLDGTDAAFPLENGTDLPLRHDLFDDDAIVLKDMAKSVTLESGSGRSVTVSFPGMDYLGIWHWPKTDAPYVCIEPWCSLPSVQDKVAVFEEQKDLLSLQPGGVYTNTWSVTVQ